MFRPIPPKAFFTALLALLAPLSLAQSSNPAAELVLTVGETLEPGLTDFALDMAQSNTAGGANILLWEIRKRDTLSECVYIATQAGIASATLKRDAAVLFLADALDGTAGPLTCDAADVSAAEARLAALGVPVPAADEGGTLSEGSVTALLSMVKESAGALERSYARSNR